MRSVHDAGLFWCSTRHAPVQPSAGSKLIWGFCAEYCESLPDAAASDRCWQAYNFFESKKREAEGSCSLEEASGVAGGSGMTHACRAVQGMPGAE